MGIAIPALVNYYSPFHNKIIGTVSGRKKKSTSKGMKQGLPSLSNMRTVAKLGVPVVICANFPSTSSNEDIPTVNPCGPSKITSSMIVILAQAVDPCTSTPAVKVTSSGSVAL